jgi:hypothetical protein
MIAIRGSCMEVSRCIHTRMKMKIICQTRKQMALPTKMANKTSESKATKLNQEAKSWMTYELTKRREEVC